MREIRMLRAMWRGLETGLRMILLCTKEETPATDKGLPSGLPRQSYLHWKRSVSPFYQDLRATSPLGLSIENDRQRSRTIL